MSALPYQAPSAEPQESIAPWLWTRDTYHAAANAGVFDNQHVELIGGSVYVEVSPQSARHSSCLRKCVRLFPRVLTDEFSLQVQQPVALSLDSEPEPDLAVLRSDPDLPEHPDSSLVVLAIEISETSVQSDRRRKGTAYAAAGIPEYWIINLPSQQLEVYRNPVDARYQMPLIVGETDVIRPLFAPDVEILVSDLLPKK